jgi:hypothetical protein
MAPLQQTNRKKMHHLSFLEEIDDKDVLLALQAIRQRTRKPPVRNTPKPNTPVAVVPAKISHRGRAAPYKNASGTDSNKEAENSAAKDPSVQRSTTPSILDPIEAHPEEESELSSPLSSFFGQYMGSIQNVMGRSCSTTGSSSYPTSKEAPKIQKKAQIRPKQPAANGHTLKETKLDSEAPQEDKKKALPSIVEEPIEAHPEEESELPSRHPSSFFGQYMGSIQNVMERTSSTIGSSYPPNKAPIVQKKAQIRPKQPADGHPLKETKLSSEAPQDDKKNAIPSIVEPIEAHPEESKLPSWPPSSIFGQYMGSIQNVMERTSSTIGSSYPPSKAPIIQKKAQIRQKKPADGHPLKETKLSSEAPQEAKTISNVEIKAVLLNRMEQQLQSKMLIPTDANSMDASLESTTTDVMPIKEHINELTAAVLDLAGTYLDEMLNIQLDDDDSTQITGSSLWDDDTALTLDESLTLNELVQRMMTHFSGSTFLGRVSIGKSHTFTAAPPISSILNIVSCHQDNASHLYEDDASMMEEDYDDYDDDTLMTADFTALDKPPLRAFKGQPHIPGEVALRRKKSGIVEFMPEEDADDSNSLSSSKMFNQKGENCVIVGVATIEQDTEQNKISHLPKENSLSHASDASKNDVPPIPKSPGSTSGASIAEESAAFVPAISSFLEIVSCQDTDIYRYKENDREDDDASMKENQNFLSALADDGTLLSEDFTALDKPPPLKAASKGPQVSPRKVSALRGKKNDTKLIHKEGTGGSNSLSSEILEKHENYKIVGVTSEDTEQNKISHAPEVSKNNTPPRPNKSPVSKNDNGSSPPLRKSPSRFSGAFRKRTKLSPVKTTPTRRGSECVSSLAHDGVSAKKDTEDFVETPKRRGAPAQEHNSSEFVETKQCATPNHKRSSSEGNNDLSVQQASSRDNSYVDRGDKSETTISKGSVASAWLHELYESCKKNIGEVGDEDSPPSPPIALCSADLRSTTVPLFVQHDTEEGQPLVGISMSQPKGWVFDLTNISFTFDESVSQSKGQTNEQPNAVDANANIPQSTKNSKGWKFDLTNFLLTFDGQDALSGEVRSKEPVKEDTSTMQSSVEPEDQPESEGIEVDDICGSKKRRGWGRLKWRRRGGK